MMDREEFLDLYEKNLNGTATEAEKYRLASYKDDMRLADSHWDDNIYTEQEVYSRIWKKLWRSRRFAALGRKYFRRAWLNVAALILAGLAMIWVWFPAPQHPKLSVSNKIARASQKVVPGSNQAVLTLASGRQITLGAAHNGQLAREGGVQVSKSKNGMLVYKAPMVASGQNKAPSPSVMNRIVVPRGGQYQLTLSDGTKVWLNAASVLDYPARFSQHERRVKLSGEAYFEVYKEPAAPFIVESRGQEVRVLGTHFNISAYDETAAVKTSLLEGSVRVAAGGKTVALRPGQQSTNHLNGTTDVAPEDVAQSIAWKNGFFQFTDASVEEVLQQVSRWYDVTVIYEGKPPFKQFSGTVSRQESLATVLEMLSYTGVHLRLHQRQVLVSH